MRSHFSPHFSRTFRGRNLFISAVVALGLTSASAAPLRVVASGGRIGVGSYTTGTTFNAFWQRTPHKLGGPVAEIDVGFMNWVHTTSAEAANGTEITIDCAWIERAATGQVIPLTFAGERKLVMPANDPSAYHLADPIPSSAWTGSAPAQDEVFWLQAKGSATPGGVIYQGSPSTFSGAKFIVYNPANDPGTKDFSGAVPTISGQSSRTTALPTLFLGRYSGPGHLAVIGIGDSILHGMGDAENPTPVITGFGFFNRAALDASGKNTIAMLNLTRSGETASTWVKNHARQAQLLPFANVVVEEFGTNDLGSGGTGTPATILANLDSIWSTCRAAGVQKIVRTLLCPRTASTDSWSTLSGQTPNTGWGADGKRDTINAGLQTALAAGKVDALVDTLTPVSDPSDNHCWLTSGTSKYATTDGTHPSGAGYALLAPGLRAALLSLAVDDYSAWAAGIDWSSADQSPDADPDGDGVTNFLAYALRISPLAGSGQSALPAAEAGEDAEGSPWVGLAYRKNSVASDIAYKVRTSEDLVVWEDLSPDGSNVTEEIADPDPDGDGGATVQLVKFKPQSPETKRFFKLEITK